MTDRIEDSLGVRAAARAGWRIRCSFGPLIENGPDRVVYWVEFPNQEGESDESWVTINEAWEAAVRMHIATQS